MEKQYSTETIYDGKIVHLVKDKVLIDDKNTATREVVKHVGGACIALKDKDGKFFLVKQYRYAQGRDMLEFCAGKLEKGEFHRETIIREAREELGYTIKNLQYLGEIIPTCAYSTEHIHMYYAEADIFVGYDFDEDERIETVKMSYEEILELIKANKITDAKTICTMYKIKLFGLV